jgi:aspartate racemase
MKTLGILGGIGPESTIDYYRLLISSYRERVGDGSSPAIVIDSLDVNKLLNWMETGSLQQVADYLLTSVQRLARAGADFALIAANTPHIVFDRIQPLLPIPLLSIVEAAADAAHDRGVSRVGLMGTRFTMQASFYPEVCSRRGIALVAPPADVQAYVHEIYVNELLQGSFLPETRERLLEVIRDMREHEHIQAVLLAGTELPLILRQEDADGIPLLDTTRIHVEAAVARMLS